MRVRTNDQLDAEHRQALRMYGIDPTPLTALQVHGALEDAGRQSAAAVVDELLHGIEPTDRRGDPLPVRRPSEVPSGAINVPLTLNELITRLEALRQEAGGRAAVMVQDEDVDVDECTPVFSAIRQDRVGGPSVTLGVRLPEHEDW
jgi:hypothetical protein